MPFTKIQKRGMLFVQAVGKCLIVECDSRFAARRETCAWQPFLLYPVNVKLMFVALRTKVQ